MLSVGVTGWLCLLYDLSELDCRTATPGLPPYRRILYAAIVSARKCILKRRAEVDTNAAHKQLRRRRRMLLATDHELGDDDDAETDAPPVSASSKKTASRKHKRTLTDMERSSRTCHTRRSPAPSWSTSRPASSRVAPISAEKASTRFLASRRTSSTPTRTCTSGRGCCRLPRRTHAHCSEGPALGGGLNEENVHGGKECGFHWRRPRRACNAKPSVA